MPDWESQWGVLLWKKVHLTLEGSRGDHRIVSAKFQ